MSGAADGTGDVSVDYASMYSELRAKSMEFAKAEASKRAKMEEETKNLKEKVRKGFEAARHFSFVVHARSCYGRACARRVRLADGLFRLCVPSATDKGICS